MKRSKFFKLIKSHGGEVRNGMSGKITHLISSEKIYYENPTTKIESAKKKYGIPIINEKFIFDSITKNEVCEVNEYLYKDNVGDKRKRLAKRKYDVDDEDENDENENVKKKKVKKRKKRVVKKAKGLPIPHKLSGHSKDGKIVALNNGEEVYSCTLNLTNISKNNNKFYQIQLIKHVIKDEWYLFSNWGRVGTKGQFSRMKFKTLNDGIIAFEKKFSYKTGNRWCDRDEFVEIEKKYTLIDVSYENEEEQEKTKKEKDDNDENKDVLMKEKVECHLDKRIQDFISRITDINMLSNVLKELNIDTQKMPLGNLSLTQIGFGFEILGELEKAINIKSKLKMIEGLTNEFYTKVPQNFGMKRPEIIDSIIKVQEKRQMLDDLKDLAIASNIIKESKKDNDIHPLTQCYNHLNCELKVIEKDMMMYKLINDYIKNTHGPTHSEYDLEILNIFEIKKEGELERFNDLGNKMLLWHGSGMSNFAGILSEGLKIAPPCAPKTGYMFGKGIYFADMVSKSANYCRTSHTSRVGSLLLSEVSLGKQLDKYVATFVDKDSLKEMGYDSIKGVGKAWIPNPNGFKTIDEIVCPIGIATKPGPVDSTLLYNEYIVYDESQVKMKYLVMLDFNHKSIIID